MRLYDWEVMLVIRESWYTKSFCHAGSDSRYTYSAVYGYVHVCSRSSMFNIRPG